MPTAPQVLYATLKGTNLRLKKRQIKAKIARAIAKSPQARCLKAFDRFRAKFAKISKNAEAMMMSKYAFKAA